MSHPHFACRCQAANRRRLHLPGARTARDSSPRIKRLTSNFCTADFKEKYDPDAQKFRGNAFPGINTGEVRAKKTAYL